MNQLGDVEDLRLQTTTHLGDPKTTANFIEGLQQAIAVEHLSYSLDV